MLSCLSFFVWKHSLSCWDTGLPSWICLQPPWSCAPLWWVFKLQTENMHVDFNTDDVFMQEETSVCVLEFQLTWILVQWMLQHLRKTKFNVLFLHVVVHWTVFPDIWWCQLCRALFAVFRKSWKPQMCICTEKYWTTLLPVWRTSP